MRVANLKDLLIMVSKELSTYYWRYKKERKAKEHKLNPEQIKELRLEESLPVINELGKWMFVQIKLPYLRVKSEKH